jgi:hypothetical protein
MNMTRKMCVAYLVSGTLGLLLVTISPAIAGGPGNGKGKGKHSKGHVTETHVVVRESHTHVAVGHVHFGVEHVRIIRTHYAPRYRNLPPGLRKKYERTGTLPPGWEKKMEPLPVAIERDLPRLPAGYRRGVIDAHVVIAKGNSIIDVAALF